jgi:hypothetical protein
MKRAIIGEVINFAICGALIKILDFSLFFSRYIAIQKVPKWQRRIHYTVWFILWGALTTPVTIAPIFVDVKARSFSQIRLYILAVVVLVGIGYILYFTIMSCRFIYKVAAWERSREVSPENNTGTFDAAHQSSSRAVSRLMSLSRGPNVRAGIADDPIIRNIPDRDEDGEDFSGDHHRNKDSNDDARTPSEMSAGSASAKSIASFLGLESDSWRRKLKIIALKSIGHAITMVVGFIIIIIAGLDGNRTQGLFSILTMHLWFNWRLENYFCASKKGSTSMNRGYRELNAIIHARHYMIVARMSSAGNGNSEPASGVGKSTGNGTNKGSNDPEAKKGTNTDDKDTRAPLPLSAQGGKGQEKVEDGKHVHAGEQGNQEESDGAMDGAVVSGTKQRPLVQQRTPRVGDSHRGVVGAAREYHDAADRYSYGDKDRVNCGGEQHTDDDIKGAAAASDLSIASESFVSGARLPSAVVAPAPQR